MMLSKQFTSKSARWLLVLALISLALLALGTRSLAAPNAVAQVSFINVGQGDSILLRDGNGFDVLVDGGRTSAGPTILAYLRTQGVPNLDVVVATHADADHIGGLIDVLQAADIPVLSVFYNGYPGTTLTWGNFVTAVANEGLTPAPAQYPATGLGLALVRRMAELHGGTVSAESTFGQGARLPWLEE